MADIKAIVEETAETSQYDEDAKALLAEKAILSRILVYSVEDFKGLDPNEVEKWIEGEPSVGRTPVDPGFTNEKPQDGTTAVTGMNSENRIRREGVVYFDVLFFVRTEDGLSKVIVNVEAQKDEPVKYDVEMRGIFYASREISAQLQREFSHQEYNKIQKVYSIWIIMNAPENAMARIHLVKDDVIGKSRWKEMYDVFHVVIIRLENLLDDEEGHELHRLLGALFIPDIGFEKKREVIEKEHGIQMEGNRKEKLKDMCNLGQGIMEQAMKKGLEKGLEQGMEQGLEQGMEKGLEQGIEQGVQLMGELFVRLQTEGKTEELSRVLADAQYRNELLISYGLLQEK